MARSNLSVLTGALVLRLILEGNRVTGLRYRRDGVETNIRARREVILCAGSIGSPHLLLLSGIGPAESLRALGIEVKRDAPAVGQNLQDHICYDHLFAARVPTLNNELGTWAGRIKAGLHYALLRRGPLSMSLNQAGGFVRSAPDRVRPNIQLYFCPLAYEKTTPGSRALIKVRADPALSFSASPCRPLSRGYLRLRAADAHVAPEIQPNLLSAPRRCHRDRGGGAIDAPLRHDPGHERHHQQRDQARTGRPLIRRFHRLCARNGLFDLSPGRHLPDGPRCARQCGRCQAPGAWPGRIADYRRLDLSQHSLGQYQRAGDDGGGEGGSLYFERG